jgi:chromosome segregation ATPase
MFEDLPQREILTTGGAFLVGWVLAKLGSLAKARARAAQRDPRDDRIRSLDAELRVAHSSNDKLKAQLEDHKKDLAEARKAIVLKKDEAGEQEGVIERLREDLKDSVKKTRELRTELTERAEETVRLEVRVRELETELSVAQSSPSLMASSLMGYGEDGESEPPEAAGKSRAAR